MRSITLLFNKPVSPSSRILFKTGGISAPSRTRSSKVLKISEREEISRGIAANQSVRFIADLLDRSSLRLVVKLIVMEVILGIEQLKLIKLPGIERYDLSCANWLVKEIKSNYSKKLKRKWSSEQISDWLKTNSFYTRIGR